MNVLFYRYKNICEPDVLAGFRELGLSVTEMEHTEQPAKETLLKISGFLQKHPVDFCFSINFFLSCPRYAIFSICATFHGVWTARFSSTIPPP